MTGDFQGWKGVGGTYGRGFREVNARYSAHGSLSLRVGPFENLGMIWYVDWKST